MHLQGKTRVSEQKSPPPPPKKWFVYRKMSKHLPNIQHKRPPSSDVLIPSLDLGMSRIHPLKIHRSAKFSYAHRKIGISDSYITISLEGSGKSVKIKCFQNIEKINKWTKNVHGKVRQLCPQFYLGVFRETSS